MRRTAEGPDRPESPAYTCAPADKDMCGGGLRGPSATGALWCRLVVPRCTLARSWRTYPVRVVRPRLPRGCLLGRVRAKSSDRRGDRAAARVVPRSLAALVI